jgi:hypothetical protein
LKGDTSRALCHINKERINRGAYRSTFFFFFL